MRRRSFLAQGLAGGLTLASGLAAPVVRAQAAVDLRMSWWGGNDVHRAQLRAIEAFQRRHPHIRIKPEYTGWAGHLERLTTQIAGGTAPDVMQVNWNWLRLFSRDGQGFQDLNRLSNLIDLSQFPEDAITMSTVAGRLNGLPPSMTARLFYFNETTFQKAGLPLPDSWEALLAAGPQFRDRLGPDHYPLDVNFQDLTALLYSWQTQRRPIPFINEADKQLGPNIADLTAMARFHQQLVDQHVIPGARERASYGNVQPQELRPWISGRYAGTYQWTSAVGKFADTLAPGQSLALAPYPMLPGAETAGLLYKPSMMLAINRDTPHVEAAALLVNFMLNDPEGVAILGARRGVPASQGAASLLAARGELPELARAGQAQVETLPRTLRISGYFEHARVRDGFNDILEKQGYGRLTAEEAGQALYKEINGILHRVIR